MSTERSTIPPTSTTGRGIRRRRDGGFTLTELLITMSLMGLLATVLSAAITVTLRTVTSTEGRANVARAESAIDTWLPADLASTDVNADPAETGYIAADTSVGVTPCAGGGCGSIDFSGVNALQLTWETPDGITRVQYHYVKRGDEWVLERIECRTGRQCTRTTVLHDLQPPDDEADFMANPIKPIWVMDVSIPDPTATPDLTLDQNAREILVTIDGGGSGDGAGGGTNNVKLTAGGRTSIDIPPDKFEVPSFRRSKSRCGGPVTLIVDSSGSVGGALESIVKPGVVDFINTFRGTQTQLQIVDFDNKAQVIGPGSGWHRYYDMTNMTEVDNLIKAVEGVKDGPPSKIKLGGGTNWEDAFFRTFKDSKGNKAKIQPGRVVFFTDGEPTLARNSFRDDWRDTYHSGERVDFNKGTYPRVGKGGSWPNETGAVFFQEGWDRTDRLLEAPRADGVDFVFVGVGNGLKKPHDWIHNKAVYDNLAIEPSDAVTRTGSEVVAQLVKGVEGGHTPAKTDDGTLDGDYINTDVANYYRLDFNKERFSAAMRAAALKGCGGTLNIQTRLDDGTPNGTPVDAEFVYENPAFYNAAGDKIDAKPRRSSTSGKFKTGGFDFDIAGSTNFYEVDVVPAQLETIEGYEFVEWTCAAGITDKKPDVIDIDDSLFKGIQVQVRPNEAVFCIMKVKKTP